MRQFELLLYTANKKAKKRGRYQAKTKVKNIFLRLKYWLQANI